jgi:hypothetical protein
MGRSRKIPRLAQSRRAIIQAPLRRSPQLLPRPRRRRLKPSARLLLQPTRDRPRRRRLVAELKLPRLRPLDPQLLRPDLQRNRPRLISHRHQLRTRQRHRPHHPRLPRPRPLVPNPPDRHLVQKRAPASLTLQRRRTRPKLLLALRGPLSHPSPPRLNRVLLGLPVNDLARVRPQNLQRKRQRSGSAILCPPPFPSRWSRSASKAKSRQRSRNGVAVARTTAEAFSRTRTSRLSLTAKPSRPSQSKDGRRSASLYLAADCVLG